MALFSVNFCKVSGPFLSLTLPLKSNNLTVLLLNPHQLWVWPIYCTSTVSLWSLSSVSVSVENICEVWPTAKSWARWSCSNTEQLHPLCKLLKLWSGGDTSCRRDQNRRMNRCSHGKWRVCNRLLVLRRLFLLFIHVTQMTSKTSLALCFTAKTFCNAFRQMKKALQTQYANHRAKLQNWFDFFFVLITGCLFRELHFPATKRDSVSGVKLCNSACGICCENFPPNCAWQGEEVWWLPRRVMGSLFCACLKCCSPAAAAPAESEWNVRVRRWGCFFISSWLYLLQRTSGRHHSPI